MSILNLCTPGFPFGIRATARPYNDHYIGNIK